MAFVSPSTALKWTRWLARKADYPAALLASYLLGLLDTHEEVSDPLWMRFHVIQTRTTPTGTSEDKSQFKIDIVNITAGAVDPTWTAADFAACKAALDTYVTALRPLVATSETFSEYRAYPMRFNPAPDVRFPFAPTGPAAYRATLAIAGTGLLDHARQVSMAVTLKTAFPRHWGRMYLPQYGKALDANARFYSADTITAANAAAALVNNLAASEMHVVVPMGQYEKSPFHALLGVTAVQVDDIPDVIRRRRPRQAVVRTVVAT